MRDYDYENFGLVEMEKRVMEDERERRAKLEN